MESTAINRILSLPRYLERNSIYRANSMFAHFGIRFADGVIRFFENEPAARSITYKVDLFIEGKAYDGELEIFRDGSHAVRMA